jgi:hypothetical protein
MQGPVEDDLPSLGLERPGVGGDLPWVGRLQVEELPQRHRLVPEVVPKDVPVLSVGRRVEQLRGVLEGHRIRVHEDHRSERRRVDGEDLELVAKLPP